MLPRSTGQGNDRALRKIESSFIVAVPEESRPTLSDIGLSKHAYYGYGLEPSNTSVIGFVARESSLCIGYKQTVRPKQSFT